MKQMLVILCFLSFSAISQDEIKWDVNYNEAENELKFTAKLADGWHIYSQFMDENAGPIPTSFEIDGENIELIGKVIEPEPTEVYDENFGSDIAYFSDKTVFTQKLKENSKGLVNIEIVYMLCNDEGCLPPSNQEFKVEIK
ncbi:MAG: protein-disulfide reductase DsbD N-terminal domain-containing protein [Brumimicrobium sp.]